jgi:uncharacterized damage-inducible protein DinB
LNWIQLLKSEAQRTHAVTAKLMDLVDPASLGWKPESGNNWMTMGQLLKHLTTACGAGCRGFVCDEWDLPPGKEWTDLTPEEMLPKAEMLPAIDDVAEAKRLLQADEVLTLAMVDRAGEEALEHRVIEAPWIPGMRLTLGQWILQMIQHLDQHKSQLFYYLKLQGKPVGTVDLWGL